MFDINQYEITLTVIWQDVLHPDLGIRSAMRGYLLGMKFAFDITHNPEQAQECKFLWEIAWLISNAEHQKAELEDIS